MRSKLQSSLRLERLDDRCVPSVTPANGQEYGTTTLPMIRDYQADGTNLGLGACSIEKGECAAESIAFLQPPGQV